MTRPDYGHGEACLCQGCCGAYLKEQLHVGLQELRKMANIRVDGYTYTDTGRDFFMMHHDGQEVGRFFDRAEAETFADELALDLLEAGQVGTLEPAA